MCWAQNMKMLVVQLAGHRPLSAKSTLSLTIHERRLGAQQGSLLAAPCPAAKECLLVHCNVDRRGLVTSRPVDRQARRTNGVTQACDVAADHPRISTKSLHSERKSTTSGSSAKGGVHRHQLLRSFRRHELDWSHCGLGNEIQEHRSRWFSALLLANTRLRGEITSQNT